MEDTWDWVDWVGEEVDAGKDDQSGCDNNDEQAGAELGQAQIKIGYLDNLANFTYYIYLIELAI